MSFTSLTATSIVRRFALLFATLSCLLMTSIATAQQQQLGTSSVPRDTYYFAKQAYYEGDYREAFRGATSALRTGVRIGQRRWIDSVCYYTLLGEINYQQGKFAAALDAHELALQVHIANTGWMSRLSYPRIGPSKDRVQLKIGWGRRPTTMAQFPDSISSLEGSFDLQKPFEIGGPVNPAHTRRVDAVEVFRCLAVSLRRRAELLGDTGPLSNKTTGITASFANLSVPPGHWVSSWIEVLYGLALLSESRYQEAIGHLNSGTTAGAFDHPLTGIALLEQGKLQLKKGQFTAAAVLLQQASLAGARYRQADVMEESFRYLTDAFLAAEGLGVFPAIDTAVLYARTEGFAKLVASLQMNAAEVAVYGNNPGSAAGLLTQARAILAPRGLLATEIGGRLAYLEAITQYRAGNKIAAAKSIKNAVAAMQRASLPAFHLSIIERLHAAGRRAISPDNAIVLYSRVLREPTDNDWRARPLETITMLVSSHTAPMERWFELLINRREYDTAVRVAEQLRRHRFYSTLPFGGRVLSLRWLVEGDRAMLGKRGMEQKNRLRTKYPALAQWSTAAEKIRLNLAQSSLVPKDEDAAAVQKKRVAELRRISDQAENLLHEIALRREPVKLVFPPQPSLSAIKAGIKPNQAILYFVTTDQAWHAWFIRRGQDDYWRIRNPKLVRRGIASLLKSIGNRDGNAQVNAALVASDHWKNPAGGLWKVLVGELPDDAWKGLDELVIVPDGVLWYLPFDLLRIPETQLGDAVVMQEQDAKTVDGNEDLDQIEVEETEPDADELPNDTNELLSQDLAQTDEPNARSEPDADDEVDIDENADAVADVNEASNFADDADADQNGVAVADPIDAEQEEIDDSENPAKESDGYRELLSLVRVRYAPIASLSVGDQRGHKADLKTTVVGGQLFPKESSAHAGEMLKVLKENLNEVEVVGKRKPFGSSRFTAGAMERLIVWNDIKVNRNSPYGWSPAQYDRSSNESTLADWIELPWGGPDQLIAPGFHTAAEKTLGKNATGHEIFLTACGLLATGTRTALLSRWRTGGKVPAVLVREFTLGLKNSSASESWQNAVAKASSETLSAKSEPRIKPATDDTISARHPFFRSAYLLLDTGAEPTPEPIPAENENVVVELAGELGAANEPQADNGDDEGKDLPADKTTKDLEAQSKDKEVESNDEAGISEEQIDDFIPLHEDPVDEVPLPQRG